MVERIRNLFDKIFYNKNKIQCKLFSTNTVVEIEVGHQRMNEKSICILGKIGQPSNMCK